MSPENNSTPSPIEVANALERMLGDPVFKSHPKQAEVFAYIVKSTLDNKEVTEKSIRQELFPDPPYKPMKNHVRVTVHYVRDRIAEYYAGAGRDDTVVISLPSRKEEKLPPGEAYKPRFSYNPSSEANLHWRRGVGHVSQLALVPIVGLALEAFKDAIEADPTYGPAHASLAEARLLLAFFSCHTPPAEFLAAAEASAHQALLCNSDTWMAHTILGAVQACRWNWNEAKDAFDASERTAPREAGISPWYAAFRLATSIRRGPIRKTTSRVKFAKHGSMIINAPDTRVTWPGSCKALDIMRMRAVNGAGDIMAQCVYGLFTHVVRDISSDWDVVSNASKDISWNWVKNIVDELEAIANGEIRDGMLRVPVLYIPLLGDCTPKLEGYVDLLKDDPFLWPRCPGLLITFAAFRGFEKDARELLEELQAEEQDQYVRPLQLALGHLAVGDHKNALTALARAADERDPFLVWLHLWPVFEPLYNDDEFSALIERIGIPILY